MPNEMLAGVILARHLTGDPADMAGRATSYLRSEPQLFLTDLAVAETVHVLGSFYRRRVSRWPKQPGRPWRCASW